MSVAWHIAALPRMKRFPRLQELFAQGTQRDVQTPEQLLAVIRTINAMHGGIEKGVKTNGS